MINDAHRDVWPIMGKRVQVTVVQWSGEGQEAQYILNVIPHYHYIEIFTVLGFFNFVYTYLYIIQLYCNTVYSIITYNTIQSNCPQS